MSKNEPTLEVSMSLSSMLDTIEALAKMQIELHQVVTDAEPGSQLDIAACNKLISIIDVKQDMESVVMEALKE